MKLGKIIVAYKILNSLSNEKFPFSEAYRFYKLQNSLKEDWEFQVDNERKIFDKYNAEIINGEVSLKDPKDAPLMFEDLKALSETNIELENVPVCIKNVPDTLKLTAKDISDLDGILVFE